jgi:uncharacterized protein
MASLLRGGDRSGDATASDAATGGGALQGDDVRVTDLFVYPVKSLAGIRVSRANVADRGFAGDRRYLLVDDDGRMLTQREHPRLSRVRTAIDELAGTLSIDDTLTLPLSPTSASSGATGIDLPRCVVQIWDDRVEACVVPDRGYFSELMGASTRIVYLPDDVQRPVSAKYGRPGDQTSFADAFPFLVVSRASLEALSRDHERAGGEPLDVRRFRPNIVLGGLAPWAEEADTFRSFRLGETLFHAVKPCSRCVLVEHDPQTGERLGSVLRTLARTRRRDGDSEVYFGVNLVHDGRGEVRVGERVLSVDG